MSSISRGVVLALGLVVATSGVALAQPGAPPPPPPGAGGPYQPPPPPMGMVREGFIIGFSLGGGSMVPDCEGCESESGVAFDIHLGGMITPQLAIMWDGSGVAHTEDNLTLINAVNTAAAQFFVAPKIWIKGGIGFGRLSVSSDGDTIAESETAAALLAAAGIEVLQSGSFALDLSVRLVPVMYDEASVTNVAFNVGVNWY